MSIVIFLKLKELIGGENIVVRGHLYQNTFDSEEKRRKNASGMSLNMFMCQKGVNGERVPIYVKKE